MKKYGNKQRKILLLILAVLFIIKLISSGAKKDEIPSSLINNQNWEEKKIYIAYVEAIVDGDTIKVIFENPETELFNKAETIRLIGLDTPELFTTPVETGAEDARNFTNSKLYQKTVYIDFDENLRDKYDRLLSYVWFYDDETNTYTHFNELIIKEGYATYYDYFPINPIYMQKFREAELKQQ